MLRQDPSVEVVGLLTTVNTEYDRVAMHSTRRKILEAQARAVGLSLHVVPLPWPCSKEVYEAEMRKAIDDAHAAGMTHMAFGDLFLEDIRAYREKQMAVTPLKPLFPIWKEPTGDLSRRMVNSGLKAVITCVDPRKLDRAFAGRHYDAAFLDDLPDGVDPCGENGEFHTCVLAGPEFREPVRARVGQVLEREGFVFADVIGS